MSDNQDDIQIESVCKEVQYDKKYLIPKLTYVKYNGTTLAIADSYGKWLVLNNENQYKILELIKSHNSIGDIIESNFYEIDDIIDVLTQIEGKQFEEPQKTKSLIKENLIIHLTNKCNLKCPHCYMKSGNRVRDELSTSEILNLCKNFKEIGGVSITLTGGEPTLRVDLLKILDYINDLNIDIYLLSNGSLWNEITIHEISKRKIKEIQFSVDGFNEESNSLVRGEGVFTKCMNAVEKLCKSGNFVSIAVTPPYKILRSNKEKYIDFTRKLLKQYGKYIKVSFTENLMFGRNLSEQQLNQFYSEYKELIREIVAKVNPDFEKDLFVSKIKNSLNNVCGYGNLVVLANGDYYFCDDIPRTKSIGNIRNSSFSQIFNEMICAEKSCNIDNFSSCNCCELRYICGGGCRIVNFPSNDMTKPFDYNKYRTCNLETKQKYYKLMISTNKDFFVDVQK